MKYQYLSERSANYSIKVTNPKDVLPVLRRYRNYKQEAFLCITLDGSHNIITVRIISIGLLNRTLVHPREVFADAITDRAAAIILAHNHPSGNVEPSEEDIQITKRMKDAGSILGIEILDHIIIGKILDYFSFLEEGKI